MSCQACDNKQKYEELSRFIAEHKDEKGPLMPIMYKAQEIFGYLPLEVQNFIAESMGIPLTDVYGVATFYSQFTLEPMGKYKVGVCMGTACYVRGAQKVMDKFIEELGVPVGKTSKDGMFTLQATRCLGACGLSPVATVNDDVYGQLTEKDVPDIVAKYRKAEA